MEFGKIRQGLTRTSDWRLSIRRMTPICCHSGPLCWRALGKRREANERLTRAEQLAPEDASVWRHRGWYHEALKEYLLAEDAHSRSIELWNDSPWTYESRSWGGFSSTILSGQSRTVSAWRNSCHNRPTLICAWPLRFGRSGVMTMASRNSTKPWKRRPALAGSILNVAYFSTTPAVIRKQRTTSAPQSHLTTRRLQLSHGAAMP